MDASLSILALHYIIESPLVPYHGGVYTASISTRILAAYESVEATLLFLSQCGKIS